MPSAGWIRMVRWWHCWRQPPFWPSQMCRWLSGHLRLHKEKHTQYIDVHRTLKSWHWKRLMNDRRWWKISTVSNLRHIGNHYSVYPNQGIDILETITPFTQTYPNQGIDWTMINDVMHQVFCTSLLPSSLMSIKQGLYLALGEYEQMNRRMIQKRMSKLTNKKPLRFAHGALRSRSSALALKGNPFRRKSSLTDLEFHNWKCPCKPENA